MNPHIAILFEFPTLSGGEFSMLSVLERLDQFEITAFAPVAGPLADALRQRQIPIADFTLQAPTGKRSREAAQSALEKLIEHHEPDHVHANSLSMSRLLGACRESLSVPTSGHLRDIMKLSQKAIADLNDCDRLVAVSQATAEYHVAQGLYPDRVQVIHNGVDLNRFQPREPKALRTELGLSPTARLIGTIGQICLRKGHDLLPQLAARLSCREHDIHFVIVGERYSTKQESIEFDCAIDSGFDELRLSSHLHRLGFREDVSQLLNDFDLLFHPARQEPLGRVLLEAAASGCPIVATHVGGTPEIVEHEKSALLFPADDAETASRHTRTIFENQALASALTTTARKRMEEQFSIDAAATNLTHCWEAVQR